VLSFITLFAGQQFDGLIKYKLLHIIRVFINFVCLSANKCLIYIFPVTVHQLNCSGNDIVRVNVGKGSTANLETQNCPGTAGAPVSTCYVSGELYLEVCSAGLDGGIPDMQVCVTGVLPIPVEASPGKQDQEL
jgi:hypothetical protein